MKAYIWMLHTLTAEARPMAICIRLVLLYCRLNFVAAVVTAAGLGITFYSTGFETGGIQSRSAGGECWLLVISLTRASLWRPHHPC
jgi:hypothetical protein